jgi:hypothetical protein
MKREILSFTIERPKHRVHKMLFDNNTPFKPKVVAPKNQYTRTPKHKGKSEGWDG